MTTKTQRTYDSKCYELAEHFAQDEHLSKEQLHELACDIQQCVEGYFEALPPKDDEPGDPDGECFRGGEYGSALAEEQAEIQRTLK
jgi:hypothetical protein